jgi:hypothetical protein
MVLSFRAESTCSVGTFGDQDVVGEPVASLEHHVAFLAQGVAELVSFFVIHMYHL